jgi:hypothetical protein
VRSDRRQGADPKRTSGLEGTVEAGEERQGLVGIGAVAAPHRYYEEVGLLHPADRRNCDANVERVRRIRDLQGLMEFNMEGPSGCPSGPLPLHGRPS